MTHTEDQKFTGLPFFRSHRPQIENLIGLAGLILAGLAVAYFRSRHADLAAVFHGYTPNVLFDPVWDSAHGFGGTEANFPNGERNTLRSLGGQLYRMLGFFPVSENFLHGVAIFLEFTALSIGAVICTRAITPGLPYWVAFLTALYLGASPLLDSDLARWGHPFYGAVYNFANGAGLAAVGLILGGRLVAAGLVLALAGMFHPIISLFFAIPCAVIGLTRITRFSITQIATAIILPAGLCGLWVALNYADAGTSGSSIDSRLFIGLSGMMSSHWYPIQLGVFGSRSWEDFIPFLAIFVMFFALLGRVAERSFPHDGVIAISVLALFATTAVGVWVSEHVASPLLIKLAFHRASAIALLLAGVVLVPRLVLIARDSPLPLALVAAAFLLLPFWRGGGWPVVGAVLFASVLLVVRYQKPGQGLAWIGAAAVLGAVTAFLGLILQGHTTLWLDSNTHLHSLGQTWFLIWTLVIIASFRWLEAPAIAAILLGYLAIGQSDRFDYFRDADTITKAEEFREIQHYARDHTPPGALFMLDPSHAYGWRYQSQRPSFGTMREWLYTSWAYDSRQKLLDAGVARFTALGLDPETYLSIEENAPGQGYISLREDVIRAYYALETSVVRHLREDYGVAYLVLEKAKLPGDSAWDFLFETPQYGILSTEQVLSH